MDKVIFTRMFKAVVRPHLEYANAVWHPSYKKTKILIENVQKRATKKLECCEGMDYEARLRFLDLPCIAYRKLRGDMIEVYKILNGGYDSDISPPIHTVNEDTITRGNKMKLSKPTFKKAARKNFFSVRVSNFWNELPNKVIEAPSIKSFERRLDLYWKKYDMKFNFDRCLDYETQKRNGTGTRNLIIQEYIVNDQAFEDNL